MPGFTELLQRVAQFYRERQPELRQQSEALVDALRAHRRTGIDPPQAR